MDKKLHILLIEDNASDARLIEHELSESGLEFLVRYVESNDQFLLELRQHPPDVILSDHGVSSFDCFAALSAARKRSPDVPFIFVTGSLGEEKAIQAFVGGAADCVLKHRLFDLAGAVRRAVDEADKRRDHKARETERERLLQELQTALARVRTLRGLLSICACCKSIRDEHGHWQSFEQYVEAHTNANFTHGICPECAWRVYGTEVEGKD